LVAHVDISVCQWKVRQSTPRQAQSAQGTLDCAVQAQAQEGHH